MFIYVDMAIVYAIHLLVTPWRHPPPFITNRVPGIVPLRMPRPGEVPHMNPAHESDHR